MKGLGFLVGLVAGVRAAWWLVRRLPLYVRHGGRLIAERARR